MKLTIFILLAMLQLTQACVQMSGIYTKADNTFAAKILENGLLVCFQKAVLSGHSTKFICKPDTRAEITRDLSRFRFSSPNTIGQTTDVRVLWQGPGGQLAIVWRNINGCNCGGYECKYLLGLLGELG
jgi:hypothetical protein